MSRSYHQHDKSWNTHKREAKFRSNKNRRLHGRRLVYALKMIEDSNDIEMIIDVPKNAGNGDIWIYD